MVDVEAAGAITGVAGFVMTVSQVVLPTSVQFIGNVWIGALTAVAGVVVWWRKRRERLERDEDRSSD